MNVYKETYADYRKVYENENPMLARQLYSMVKYDYFKKKMLQCKMGNYEELALSVDIELSDIDTDREILQKARGGENVMSDEVLQQLKDEAKPVFIGPMRLD